MSTKDDNNSLEESGEKQSASEFNIENANDVMRFDDARSVAEKIVGKYDVGGVIFGANLMNKWYYIKLVMRSEQQKEDVYQFVDEELDYRMLGEVAGDVMLYFGSNGDMDSVESKFDEWDLESGDSR